MSDVLLQRVKSSMNKEHYAMKESWLSDCIDYYMDENRHLNPPPDEITAFVINQFHLHDMRDTNSGCLPRNLANQKCTTLPGKYILQVDKMYDISTSKYKQLEKIRNVSSENIEATENENKTQEDKFQTWEPKSKRMLQLFMTDGVQDVSGIEYKAIRFKNDILPGYKLLIKGPVICRKGVMLLEEKNVVEIGGEVDSLLVKNAVENIFARALNLEENPDPYNDKSKPKKGTESTQNTAKVDDDFDIDSQMLDQIDKQVEQQHTNASKNSVTSNSSNKQSLSSKISEFNYSYQAPSISSKTQESNASSTKNSVLNTGSISKNQWNNNDKVIADFDDEGDSFLEMVDDSAFKTPSVLKASTQKNKIITTKETVSSKTKVEEFPADDEIYDLTEPHSPLFSSSKPKSQSTAKTNSQKKDSCGITASSPKTVHSEKHSNADRESTFKANLKVNPSIASSYRSTSKVLSKNKEISVATPSVSDIDNFDNNFDFNDIDMDSDGFEDYLNKNEKNNLKSPKSTQASTSNSPKVTSKNEFLGHTPLQSNTNSTASSDAINCENEFVLDFYEQCKNKLFTPQNAIQPSAKSFATSKNEQPVTAHPSSVASKNSTAKLSDKLKFDNRSKDYYNTYDKVEEKTCRPGQTSAGSLFKSKNVDTATEHSAFQTNKSSSTNTKSQSKYTFENYDADFESDFDVDFEAKMEVDYKPVVSQTEKNKFKLKTEENVGRSTTKSQDPVDNISDVKSSSSKRTASPSTSSRQKLRCVESTPKDKTKSKKITDFFDKPKAKLIGLSPLYEAIYGVLEESRKRDRIRTVVRGKVTNVVKLNLLKGENGSYFHLDGTITDGTANLDVVFSSEVLEKIVGYSTEDFIIKRKRAKSDPKIKDELREDLKKAQQILRVMDALMEIEVKKNEKTIILGVEPLTKEKKKQADERLQQYKVEKNINLNS